MKFRLLYFFISVILLTGCGNKPEDHHSEHHDHMIQYTAYCDRFELFIEADHFVAGEPASIVTYLSSVPGFRAVGDAKIRLVYIINGKEFVPESKASSGKGIYSFSFVPESAGSGILKYNISAGESECELIVNNVEVYGNHEAVHEALEDEAHLEANTSVFTKEQSWKVDFSTGYPRQEAFAQVIKTTGLVQPLSSNEFIVSARTGGIVQFGPGGIYEGNEVGPGQVLFTVSGSSLADNNFSVRYSQAKNNFERSSADMERALSLQKERIIPEKEFLEIKNRFENDRLVYESYRESFNNTGQLVTSPAKGFIIRIMVSNGEYVNAGQTLVVISQNSYLAVRMDVPQRYSSQLHQIKAVRIRKINAGRTYSLEELGGRILSYGKAAGEENFLIPVTLGIESHGEFIPGSFVEVFLEAGDREETLVVPNTAILEEQGVYFVWVQHTPELFEKREIRTGRTDGYRTEVAEGLRADERIVTEGAIYIKLAQATGALDAHSGHVH